MPKPRKPLTPRKPKRAAPRSSPKNLQSLLDAAWKQWQRATNDIDKHGPIHETEKGYRYANPAINQRKEAAALITKLTRMMGAEDDGDDVETRKR